MHDCQHRRFHAGKFPITAALRAKAPKSTNSTCNKLDYIQSSQEWKSFLEKREKILKNKGGRKCQIFFWRTQKSFAMEPVLHPLWQLGNSSCIVEHKYKNSTCSFFASYSLCVLHKELFGLKIYFLSYFHLPCLLVRRGCLCSLLSAREKTYAKEDTSSQWCQVYS